LNANGRVFEQSEDPGAVVVGERVRRLRQAAGKSLRAQARELGVSPSSLSMLENGRGGTSLARLQLVARHFGLPVTDLLAEAEGAAPGPAEAPEVIRTATMAPGLRRGHGTLYHLLGHAHGHALQPYVLAFEPGGGYEGDPISHAGEEFAYVVFGEVELLSGAHTVRLAAGDAVRFATEPAHAFRNASRTASAIVVGAATPPW
jgi:transcriptional regulator with XRE-family HTH domain